MAPCWSASTSTRHARTHYLAQGQQFLPVLTLLEPAQIVGGCAGPHLLCVLTIPWLIARFFREVVALLPHLSSLIVESPS